MTPPSRLWDFSLAQYARPGVAPACLRCQDEAGADVNIILFLLWHAARGQAVTDVTDIDRAVRVWRDDAVRPLRAVRQFLKPLAEATALRDAVKAAELEAERLEQAMLERLDVPQTPAAAPTDAARASLTAYAAYLTAPLPPDCIETFVALMPGCG